MTAEDKYKSDKARWIETEKNRQADLQLHVDQLSKEVEYFEYQVSCNKQRLVYASKCLLDSKAGLKAYMEQD